MKSQGQGTIINVASILAKRAAPEPYSVQQDNPSKRMCYGYL